MPADEAAPALRQLAADLRGKGAAVFVAEPGEAAGRLPALAPDHPRNRRHLPDPELLRHGGSAGGAARQRRRPAAPPAEGDTHTMSRPGAMPSPPTRLFDGDTVRQTMAWSIEDGRSSALRRAALPQALPGRRLPDGAWLAPGFIDVQVNGGGDALFNNDPTPKTIAAIAAAHRHFGTTVAAADADQRHPREDARRRSRRCRRRCEGEPGRARHPSGGAVPLAGKARRARAAMIRAPTEDDLGAADESRGGATLVTLRAGMRAGRFVRRARRGGRAGLARPFDGDLRGDARGDRRWAHRLHASLQRDAAARLAASPARSPPRSKRRGAGTD